MENQPQNKFESGSGITVLQEFVWECDIERDTSGVMVAMVKYGEGGEVEEGFFSE